MKRKVERISYNMDDINKLLPCPFCGGKAKIFGKRRDRGYYITCTNDDCDCSLGHSIGYYLSHKYETKKDAVSAWNKRSVLTNIQG